MAGYSSRSIKKQKKKEKKKMRPRYSLLTSRSVNKGFIRLAGPTREIPSGQDGPILPTGVANHNANFASSRSLARGFRHNYNNSF